jgi:hypothetical protein
LPFKPRPDGDYRLLVAVGLGAHSVVRGADDRRELVGQIDDLRVELVEARQCRRELLAASASTGSALSAAEGSARQAALQ